MSRSVEYTCARAHQWTVTLSKACKSWCATCRKMNKAIKKQQLRELSERIERENVERQQNLFAEAKLKYHQSCFIQVSDFESIFVSVIEEAKEKAVSYASESELNVTVEESLAVFKMLLLDPASFEAMMIDSKVLKSGFKRLALALHPDKNKHPLSKEAFQKASELFN
jgi:hypothetical protein